MQKYQKQLKEVDFHVGTKGVRKRHSALYAYICESKCLRMAMHGHVWSCMVKYGNYGHEWLCKVTYGHLIFRALKYHMSKFSHFWTPKCLYNTSTKIYTYALVIRLIQSLFKAKLNSLLSFRHIPSVPQKSLPFKKQYISGP